MARPRRLCFEDLPHCFEIQVRLPAKVLYHSFRVVQHPWSPREVWTDTQ
jgi:hypothetical protein